MVSSSLPLRKTSNRVVSFVLAIYYLFEAILLWPVPASWRFKSIKGQTVLITGAASGIGQLMAVKFAKLGIAKLVLWDVNEEGLRQTVELVKNEPKTLDESKIYTFQVNLASREEIYATAEKVKLEVGPVDILVNNAGIVSGYYLLDLPDQKIEQTFDINVLAHFYTVKSFLPDMVKQKRGHIVTVASSAGHMVAPKAMDYCCSKFANVGFDLALRIELAQANLDEHIHTTIVKPWLMSTPMFEGVSTGILPIQKPEYVAQRIVDGVLSNTREVLCPRILWIFFLFNLLLPQRASMACADFAGAMDMMANFHGRPVQLPSKKESAEINNNNEKSKLLK